MNTPSRVALAMVLLLLVVFGLFRIAPIDVPQHLVLGRLMWEQGAPITTNALSWTFPDHPNQQQYPLYQLALYGLQTQLGWWSLSVFCGASWTAAALAWLRWGGGVVAAQGFVFLWFVAVVGVQRHLVARPEVFTLLGLALLLVAFEVWRTRRGPLPLVAMVVTLWGMVNTHQMYIVGVVLLFGFIVHVAASRALAGRGWVDEADAGLPLGPLVATLGAAWCAVAISPLGVHAWTAPWALVTTIQSLGASSASVAESAELQPIWTDLPGFAATLVLCLVVAVQGWRSRGRWQVIELGVLAMGFGMVAIALRGVPFFALAAAAVATRWGQRARAPWLPADSVVPGAANLATALLAGVLALTMVLPRPHVYLARQQGLGRSVGEWGEAVTGFLRESPPPGEMLNIGWVAANYLTYGVYPTRRVFVDGRWETYPKDFLNDSMLMQREPAVLDRMIATWDPGFVVAEMRLPQQQDQLARLVSKGWRVVYVDSIAAVAVVPSIAPEVTAYLGEHGADPLGGPVPDWLPAHPILHAQQQARVAGLYRRLGARAQADALREAAAAHADHPSVASDLARFR